VRCGPVFGGAICDGMICSECQFVQDHSDLQIGLAALTRKCADYVALLVLFDCGLLPTVELVFYMIIYVSIIIILTDLILSY
jgi:hypothetical protein